MAIVNNEFGRQQETKSNNSTLGIIKTWVSKTLKSNDTVDADGIYLLKVDSLTNGQVVESSWINVEEYDVFFVSGISTDNGTLTVLFSDGSGEKGNDAPPDDNNIIDGASISLVAHSFAKINGVSANVGEITDNINTKWLKVTYTASSTASGKPLRVKCLVVR